MWRFHRVSVACTMASTIETYLGEAKKHRKNLEALVAKLEHAENDGAAERVRGHPVQLRRSRGLPGPAAPALDLPCTISHTYIMWLLCGCFGVVCGVCGVCAHQLSDSCAKEVEAYKKFMNRAKDEIQALDNPQLQDEYDLVRCLAPSHACCVGCNLGTRGVTVSRASRSGSNKRRSSRRPKAGSRSSTTTRVTARFC